MNREVMDRQMFRYGGGVPMQEGGVPPAPMPMPMPMPEIDPEQVEINQAAEGAVQNGIDPAVLEGMLGQYSQQMTGLDSAEDYETVINGIRGDNLPMEARYAELSDLVGPEDAQQTPESVLALLQPVMMLAGADQEAEGVDQGIGGLAQDEMMAPIEGPMAEGIMSTVNMEPPPEEMMVAMGGTTPVNFNQGGAVQYMKDGGGASDPRTLQTAFDETKDIYQSLLGSQVGEYDEQKNMTKAQMLFDIAQGALAFATPGERRMSPAERLAQSFTPVLGNIGARVGELNKFKQAQAKEGRALDVAALGSAEKTLAAEKAAEAALEAARIKAERERATTPGVNIMVNGQIYGATPGTPGYNALMQRGGVFTTKISPDVLTSRTQYTLEKDLVIGDKTYRAGTSPFFSDAETAVIFNTYGNDALTEYVKPLSDKDYLTAYKMTKDNFDALSPSDQQYLQGLPVITDKDYFTKFSMFKNDFLSLPAISRLRLLGIEPEYEFKQINNGKTIDVVRYDKNDPTVDPVSIYSTDILQDPDLFKITMPNADGVSVATVVDLTTDSGKTALAKVNELNKATPGSAVMQKIGTESFVAKTFLVPNSTPGGGAEVRMSFDGGQSYIGSDGLPRQLPPNAFELSNRISNDVYRKEKVRSSAKDWLQKNDTNINEGMVSPQGSGLSQAVTKDNKALVTDTLQLIRNGTGLWSGVGAAINGVVGGTLAGETFSKLFRDTEQGRQYVQLIRIMGRSALASSPRFAIADLQATEKLFPNEQNLFVNPYSEAKKLVVLVEALKEEEIRLHEVMAKDTPQDPAVLLNASQKLQEIARLKELLGPVLMSRNSRATTETFDRGKSLMRNKIDIKAANRGLPIESP